MFFWIYEHHLCSAPCYLPTVRIGWKVRLIGFCFSQWFQDSSSHYCLQTIWDIGKAAHCFQCTVIPFWKLVFLLLLPAFRHLYGSMLPWRFHSSISWLYPWFFQCPFGLFIWLWDMKSLTGLSAFFLSPSLASAPLSPAPCWSYSFQFEDHFPW